MVHYKNEHGGLESTLLCRVPWQHQQLEAVPGNNKPIEALIGNCNLSQGESVFFSWTESQHAGESEYSPTFLLLFIFISILAGRMFLPRGAVSVKEP